jgi:serine protease Do
MAQKHRITSFKSIIALMVAVVISTCGAFALTSSKATSHAQVSKAVGNSVPIAPGLIGFADVVTPLMPAVVNISTVQKPKRGARGFREGPPEELMPYLERLLPPGMLEDPMMEPNRKLISLGSGFIIDSQGYIVTNYHVIADSSEITVKLYSGASMKAKIVGVDQATDIALLKIDSKKPLSFAKFGDSDKARVGDWIIAIGNPFGLGNTVTTGIVSANGRDIALSEGVVDNFIQTDAAINRGNSGGPMFNVQGEVIGINTVILSPDGGNNIGIGFATPASIVEPVIKQLQTTGQVVSGFLGVTMQILTEDLAESMDMENNKGALVIEVGKNTPASRAGIAVGDVITSFNNKTVKSTKELQRIVRNSPIGVELPMTVLRHKSSKNLVVKLEKISTGGSSVLKKLGDKFNNLPKFSSYKKLLGATVSKLDGDLRNKFGLDSSVNGIVLLEINDKSQWSSQDFMVGDVLLSVDRVPLTSVDQLEKAIKDAKDSGKKSIFFLVQKKGMRRFISLPLEQ